MDRLAARANKDSIAAGRGNARDRTQQLLSGNIGANPARTGRPDGQVHALGKQNDPVVM